MLVNPPGGDVGPAANTEEKFDSVAVLSFGVATKKLFPAFCGLSLDFQEGFPRRKRLAEAGIHKSPTCIPVLCPVLDVIC